MVEKGNRQGKRPVKPPPDYLSRRVQMKILLMLGTLALVIFMMSEARDPDNWRWLTDLDKQPAEQPEVETRMPTPPQGEDLEPGTLVLRESQPLPTSEQAPDALDEASLDGWHNVLQKTKPEDRILLRKALKLARDGQPLETEQAKQLVDGLVPQLDQLWQDYHDQAFLVVAGDTSNLSDEDKSRWLELLDQSKRRWQKSRTGLLSLAGDEEARQAARADWEDVQSLLDKLALRQVRDNWMHRPEERPAWFRFLERLSTADPDQLRSSSTAVVSFLQLFNQPEQYRGRLVTVRGTARGAYRLQAPRNIYGIDSYYLFWVHPDGSDAPIAVFSLETPEGFPSITDGEKGGQTKLDERVEFTGFFFKKWAYAAQGRAYIAPLLLAKIPEWTPAPAAVEKQGSPIMVLLGCLLAAGAVAAVLSVWAFRSSQG